ncbi:MAG: arylsulfatase A-like enzyme, partial [Planctomycetota bacterium]
MIDRQGILCPRSESSRTASHAFGDCHPIDRVMNSNYELLPLTSAGFIPSVGFALAAFVSSCGGSSALEPNKRNLLLVTIDTVRVDHLGAYGYELAKTPSIDALAERGVVFEQAYTPAPMTLPAHSTMMTGLLPPEHGARVNGVHKLDDEIMTLAERLSANGYRTGGFVAAFVLNAQFGLAQGFDFYDDDLSDAYEQDVENGLAKYRPGNQVVDSALEWLKQGDGAKPFFAWVHMYDAHYPWHSHGAGDENDDRANYDAEITFVDQQYGRLADWLYASGEQDNTVVVVVADHGEGLGDHHEIEHAYLLNEEVLHVPLIFAGPGSKAGHRVNALVSLEDLQPTMLELLQVPVEPMHGRSLVTALSGQAIESGESYAETDLPWTSFRWAPQRSLTTAEWKYVRTPQIELYNRETDLSEKANLAVARKKLAAELEQRLTDLEAKLGSRSSTITS